MNVRAWIIVLAAAVLLCNPVVRADAIPVANHSFEFPVTDYAIPDANDWDEMDIDPSSQNTGVFANYPGDAYIVNADANQVAFLIAMQGNAFQQELPEVYQVGKSYQLTIAVGISFYSPPEGPEDPLELAFFYKDKNQQTKDIAVLSVPFERRSATYLDDFTLSLPKVQPGYGWAGKNIGIAIRGTSDLGGAWIFDNVRVQVYPSTPNFTDDAVVNLADFAKIAAEWLLCGPVTADVTGEGCVNEADLFILMEYWLQNV